jgi:hypothetical protein
MCTMVTGFLMHKFFHVFIYRKINILIRESKNLVQKMLYSQITLLPIIVLTNYWKFLLYICSLLNLNN